MLRITIELLPLGSEEHKRHLGTAEIWNDATGSLESGNYRYRLYHWGNSNGLWRSGNVTAFPRLNRGPWDLLFLVLLQAVSDRNRTSVLACDCTRKEERYARRT
jgi:hypothetical protein